MPWMICKANGINSCSPKQQARLPLVCDLPSDVPGHLMLSAGSSPRTRSFRPHSCPPAHGEASTVEPQACSRNPAPPYISFPLRFESLSQEEEYLVLGKIQPLPRRGAKHMTSQGPALLKIYLDPKEPAPSGFLTMISSASFAFRIL